MKIMQRGKLYWLPLNCRDIDDFLLPRIFRKFKIDYIPFTLRFCDKLFLREDKTKYSRKLVSFCQKNGIETFVVQEGIISGNPWGHLPLKADYFLCPEKDRDWWLERGMPKDRIQVYTMQKQAHEYPEIVFMQPFYIAENFLHQCYWNDKNVKVMQVLMDFMKKDCVFKLHNKNKEIMKKFIPFNRLVEGDAKDLIRKYKKVYAFDDSSIKRDCEMLGVECEIL